VAAAERRARGVFRISVYSDISLRTPICAMRPVAPLSVDSLSLCPVLLMDVPTCLVSALGGTRVLELIRQGQGTLAAWACGTAWAVGRRGPRTSIH
jgi:hypothetical protein